MKKIFTILGIVATITSVSAQSNVLTENFAYPDGTSLTTNNATTSWFQHSGTQGQIGVLAGTANIVAGNSEDINKALTSSYSLSSANSSYKVEYIVELNVLNSTGLSSGGDYFMSLTGTVTSANVTTGITALPGRLYAKASTSGVLFGTLNNSGTGSTPNYVTTEVPYNTATTVKVTYEVTKDAANAVLLQSATLQVGAEIITNTTGPQAPPANIAGIAIRQAGNATSGTGNIAINSITVNTFTPATLAVTDLINISSNFVKNTSVSNEINFGAKADVKIFSMNGQVVKSASVSENKSMNVADLAPGMYIVTGMVNGEAVSQKIMKK